MFELLFKFLVPFLGDSPLWEPWSCKYCHDEPAGPDGLCPGCSLHGATLPRRWF